MRLSVEDLDFQQSVLNWQGFITSTGLRIKDPIYIGQYKSLASHPLQKDMIEGISAVDQVNIIKILEESEVKHLALALEYLFKALKFYRATVPMNKMSLYVSHMLANLYKKKGENDASYQYKNEIVQKMEGWTKVQSSLLEDLIDSAEENKKITDLLQFLVKKLEINKVDTISLFDKLNTTLSSNLAQIAVKGLIFLKAKFENKSITCYSSVTLNVFITSSMPCILTPVKLSLLFSDPSFNTVLPDSLTLLPEKQEKITHLLIIKTPNMPPLELLKVVARYEPVNLS